MVENLFEQNLLWAVLTALFWAFASRGARRLPTRPTPRSLGRRARLGLILLTVSLLVLALRVALAVALATTAGWPAATDFVLFAAVPLTLTGTAVAAFTVPAYWRLLRQTPTTPTYRRLLRQTPATTTVPTYRRLLRHAPATPGEGGAAIRPAAGQTPSTHSGTAGPYPPPTAPAGHGNAGTATDTGAPATSPGVRLAAVSTPPGTQLTTTATAPPRPATPTPDGEANGSSATDPGEPAATPGLRLAAVSTPPGPPAHRENGGPGTEPGRPPVPPGPQTITTTAPPLPATPDGNANGSAATDPGAPATSPGLRLAGISTPPGPQLTTTAPPRPAVPAPAGEANGNAATDPGVPTDLRLAAASWRVVVPVRVCFLASLLAGGLTLHPPAPPYGGLLLLELVLLVLAASGLVLRQQRWRAVVGAPGWRRPSRARRLVRGTATVTAFAVLVTGGWALAAERSRLPESVGQDHHAHTYDTGGGPAAGQAPARDLTALTGPRTGTPDRSFTLTASARTMRLASGEQVAALAFNGQLPGPELRVREGELVEVVLVNRDVRAGVTLHWHGVDVPAAEDGVAGVTQDAVRPGERHVYRFRPPRAGTFWYHAHQQSSTAVARGLFGALVVEEPGADATGVDRTVVAHAWSVEGAKGAATGGRPGGGGALSGQNGIGGLLRTAFGDDTRLRRERVPAGTPVRLRLVNADNCPRTYSLAGTAFRVAAIDGNDVSGPTELRGTRLRIAGGGRYDVTFRQPDGPVHLTVVGDANATSASHGTEGCGEDGAYGAGQVETASLLLDPTGTADPPPTATGPLFDPLDYGSRTAATPVPFAPGTRYDRDFHLVLGNSLGFYDGRPMVLWTVNNAVYPDIPALLVRDGDLVRVSFVNRSLDDHPMHLHGHRMLVLSRNGQEATGSPWWTDTLNIAPGERFEVAFRADNPGLWMDHCHNLDHARDGMVLHLAYDGVTTPYEAGSSTGNLPE
ncbi:multicopper oxidase family protein [Streptomyces geranii]|uniref:multicopper oxidase family protein n=1 Tax=Streptomyces geranii TaxID=2058923 RepID=UPI000D0442DC|nr:multicopper oxidase family protein [Streptomyces geranii]